MMPDNAVRLLEDGPYLNVHVWLCVCGHLYEIAVTERDGLDSDSSIRSMSFSPSLQVQSPPSSKPISPGQSIRIRAPLTNIQILLVCYSSSFLPCWCWMDLPQTHGDLLNKIKKCNFNKDLLSLITLFISVYFSIFTLLTSSLFSYHLVSILIQLVIYYYCCFGKLSWKSIVTERRWLQ